MRSENVDDRLSTLPEEIVSHILSLMPTKFAVRTSILSKRWRCNWMSVTNLDFDDNHVPSILNKPLNRDYDIQSYPDLDKLTTFVDKVLEFCKSSQVELFRLYLLNMAVPESCVSKWIDRAVCLNVREFDIGLIKLDLPLSLCTCKTLTKLRLARTVGEFTGWKCPCSVNLPCLKTLDIVAYSEGFFNAFKLINGCPILESLSFEVQWCTEEEDYIFNIPTLKRLRLTLECPSLVKKVVLDLPNLEYLFVGGDMCSSFVMKDVSSLVEVSVSFSYLSFDHSWDDLLKGLNGVKSLSVQIDKFTFFGNPLCSPLPIFTNMKHMELKGFSHSRLIHQFLEMSPQLKHLCIENIDDQPEESSWIEPKFVPACTITTLTTVKFSKCKGLKWDIRFLEYMLGNAEVLKTVTITWENLKIEEETRLRAHLLKVLRASQYCEISFP